MDWVLTIFSKTLPLELAIRVWDSLFFEGEVFFWRTCVGILVLNEEVLLKSSYDDVMQFLTHLAQQDSMQEEDLFRAIGNIKLSEGKYRRVRRIFLAS